MNPHDAQRAMHAIEQHDQPWSGEQFLAWLLGFEADAASPVLVDESRRAAQLAEGHYQRVTGRVAVLNPTMIAQVGFIQGATFAAAALGRLPFPAGADEP